MRAVIVPRTPDEPPSASNATNASNSFEESSRPRYTEKSPTFTLAAFRTSTVLAPHPVDRPRGVVGGAASEPPTHGRWRHPAPRPTAGRRPPRSPRTKPRPRRSRASRYPGRERRTGRWPPPAGRCRSSSARCRGSRLRGATGRTPGSPSRGVSPVGMRSELPVSAQSAMSARACASVSPPPPPAGTVNAPCSFRYFAASPVGRVFGSRSVTASARASVPMTPSSNRSDSSSPRTAMAPEPIFPARHSVPSYRRTSFNDGAFAGWTPPPPRSSGNAARLGFPESSESSRTTRSCATGTAFNGRSRTRRRTTSPFPFAMILYQDR